MQGAAQPPPAPPPGEVWRGLWPLHTSPVEIMLTIPILDPVEVRVPAIEIRDVASNQLVTRIEILSSE